MLANTERIFEKNSELNSLQKIKVLTMAISDGIFTVANMSISDDITDGNDFIANNYFIDGY